MNSDKLAQQLLTAIPQRGSDTPIKQALLAWAGAVAVVILPALIFPLLIYQAHEIFRNSMASNWLEICLFIGTGFLLLSKRGSANFRLVAEVAIWLATANYIIFKYCSVPFSYVLAFLAIVVSFVGAWRRAKT